MTLTREDFTTLDNNDPLREFRDEFYLPEGMIYLDGNSLGAMPKAARARALEVIDQEWGEDLIKSWNKAGWFELVERLGAKTAKLIGAEADEVIHGDATGLNVYKAVAAALDMRAGRKKIIMEGSNFPTDNYMVQGLIKQLDQGHEIVFAEHDEIMDAINDDVAVLCITHVHYKTGRLLDMEAITKKAHEHGALVIWDLCHSAGALPVDLNGCNVDMAVGCTYKYLNGGPGSQAFVFVAKRHHGKAVQPLTGWWSHEAPFAFERDYRPRKDVRQFSTGTEPIISLATSEVGLDIFLRADMQEIRKKSLKLCDLFIQLIEERCSGHGFEIVTPRDHKVRGSQVAISSENGFPIIQALIDANVIGDFRAPDIMRFGFTPLYVSYTDVWDAVDRLKKIMDSGSWDQDKFKQVGSVT
ncbi:kynureninase [Pseudemcibacter aquimaris]|uniref:kynureninase n=1 Tax=Pseudemcibacter aquimaris TaxID=2857064 RepID=UPI002011EFF1|nr:kynureninase [Pseudemcibacter aquimaris]MCC3860518.1 kynureninase [Pseudemcibacter aquimaris]WDU59343.1 kynureninase [Pseudemcibacter aquimaris]